MRTHEEQIANKYQLLKGVVEERISVLLSRIDPKPLREAMETNVYGGKMVRPMITMLASAAVGGRETSSVEAATAIELLHTSSLIHDDIMDDSNLRRGRPTTHVLHGVPMAILAGDTFIALAFNLMQHLSGPNKERINQVFAASFRHVCIGQGFDLCLSSHDCSEADTHTVMVEKKTAKLLEAAALIGALSGTINEEHIQALGVYGYNLGMAFQAHDDVLDATGTESVMGKPASADLRNGKRTYLTLAYSSTVDSGVALDAIAATASLVREYTNQACNALDVLPPNEARDDLYHLALSLTERRD